jgi:ACS family pantothenate transporter-like MFS transporter
MDPVHLHARLLVRLSLLPSFCSGRLLTVHLPFSSTWTWSQNSNSWIILFLKAQLNPDGTKRFGVSELNAIPIGGCKFLLRSQLNQLNDTDFLRLALPDVLQIIVMLGYGWLSDRTGWRAGLVVVQELTLAFGAIILACWPSSFGFKMFAYFTLWLSNAAGPILVVRPFSFSCPFGDPTEPD